MPELIATFRTLFRRMALQQGSASGSEVGNTEYKFISRFMSKYGSYLLPGRVPTKSTRPLGKGGPDRALIVVVVIDLLQGPQTELISVDPLSVPQRDTSCSQSVSRQDYFQPMTVRDWSLVQVTPKGLISVKSPPASRMHMSPHGYLTVKYP